MPVGPTTADTILLGQHWGTMVLTLDFTALTGITGGSFAFWDGLNVSVAISCTSAPSASAVETALRGMDAAYGDVTVSRGNVSTVYTYTITCPGTVRSVVALFRFISSLTTTDDAANIWSLTGTPSPLWWRVRQSPQQASVAPLAPKQIIAAPGLNERSGQTRASEWIAGDLFGGLGKFRYDESEGVDRFQLATVPTFGARKIPSSLYEFQSSTYTVGGSRIIQFGAGIAYKGALYALAMSNSESALFEGRLDWLKTSDLGTRTDLAGATYAVHQAVVSGVASPGFTTEVIADSLVYRRRLYLSVYRPGVAASAHQTDGTTPTAVVTPTNTVPILYGRHDRKLWALGVDSSAYATPAYSLYYTTVSPPASAADWTRVGTEDIDVGDGLPIDIEFAAGPDGSVQLFILTTQELLMCSPTTGYTMRVTTARPYAEAYNVITSARGLAPWNNDLYFLIGRRLVAKFSGRQVTVVGPDTDDGLPNVPVGLSSETPFRWWDSSLALTGLTPLSSMLLLATTVPNSRASLVKISPNRGGQVLAYTGQGFHVALSPTLAVARSTNAVYVPSSTGVGGWLWSGGSIATFNDAVGRAFFYPGLAFAGDGSLLTAYYDRGLSERPKAFYQLTVRASGVSANDYITPTWQIDENERGGTANDGQRSPAAFYAAGGGSGRIDSALLGGRSGTASLYFDRSLLHDGTTRGSEGLLARSLRVLFSWVRGELATDGAIASATTGLTCASAPFLSDDIGRPIVVFGAGPAGGSLYTTISSVISSTQVVLATAAGTTISGATVSLLGRTPFLEFMAIPNDAQFAPLYSWPLTIDTTQEVSGRDSARQEADLDWLYRKANLSPFATRDGVVYEVHIDFLKQVSGATGQAQGDGGTGQRSLWNLTVSQRVA